MSVFRGDHPGQRGEQTGQCTAVQERQPSSVDVVAGGPPEASEVSLAMRGEKTRAARLRYRHGNGQMGSQHL